SDTTFPYALSKFRKISCKTSAVRVRFNEKTGIGAPPKYRNMGPCCSARKSKKKNKTSNFY
ncbi:hypothetical protein, partial [Enterococcus faecium]|uniref:hypothetical protein n=1 Tax=Enterococcus faecium TaxID=1352 RepID=UPI001C9CE99A